MSITQSASLKYLSFLSKKIAYIYFKAVLFDVVLDFLNSHLGQGKCCGTVAPSMGQLMYSISETMLGSPKVYSAF